MSEQRFADRRDRLRDIAFAEADVDRLIVTNLQNIRYLTGFSGSNAVFSLAKEPQDDLLGTDGRYRGQVAAESPDLPTILDRDTLIATAAARDGGALAVEASLGVGDVQRLTETHGTPLVTSGLVERLRAIKDDSELQLLARACDITAAGLAAVASEIRAGMTELSVARRLEQIFGELGAEDRAFDTIVGSGPHSAIPHHQPGDRRLEPGDLVVIDAGARVGGYHADMTRTYIVGSAPQPWQRSIHELVLQAQTESMAQYLPGASSRDINQIARTVIEAGGHGEDFTHGLGHGVGLQIHEAPLLGPRATGTLEADMAITVEPGVYLHGRGGVRIEDTLVVTQAGPRVLTEAPRDLVIVG